MQPKRWKGLFLSFIILALYSFPFILTPSTANAAQTTLLNVYVDKASYDPGDQVTITAKLENSNSQEWTAPVSVKIYHLNKLVYTATDQVTISSHGNLEHNFTWTAPNVDFQGYLVNVFTSESESLSTAIDVSSDWTKYPRYGYVAEFPSGQSEQEAADYITELSRDYHINSFQFYDWMWRHEQNIKRTDGVVDETWSDIFDRNLSLQTIRNQIKAVHNQNAKAMAYQMSYFAREGYENHGVLPQWGLYQDASHSSQNQINFNNGHSLYFFDPSNLDWQTHMIQEYKDVIDTVGFDGVHIDQVGKQAAVYNYNGAPVDLEKAFTPLINKTKSELSKHVPNQSNVTFNVVDGAQDGWALNEIATKANTDFDYTEVWWNANQYSDLKKLIEQFRTLNDRKALVLAAYMNYQDNTGDRYEAEAASKINISTNTDHAGYTGSGFADGFGEQGDQIEFTLSVTEASYYPLVFRYASGTASTRNLYIDDQHQAKVVKFPNTGGWGEWKHNVNARAYLTVGQHKIKLKVDEANSGYINLDSLTLGEFNDSSVILTDSVIAASGAFHIELGANQQGPAMLAHEYFPNVSKRISNSLKGALKSHYTFITAYENLLYDAGIQYVDPQQLGVSVSGESVSKTGLEGSIWAMSRKTEDKEILHFINLTGEGDSEWRNPTAEPSFKTNLATKYYLNNLDEISGVFVASPDINGGLTQVLNYATGHDSAGDFITFTIPQLKYWDMVYIQRGETQKPVTSVSLNKASGDIAIGQTLQLQGTIQPLNATNHNVIWTSSNSTIAIVSASGLVSGIARGTATITVTTEDGAKSASCIVTVDTSPQDPNTPLVIHLNTPVVNDNSKAVSISGTISSGAGRQVSIVVNNPDGVREYINQMVSGALGAFHFQFTISNGLKGTYQVQIGGENVGQPVTTTFVIKDNSNGNGNNQDSGNHQDSGNGQNSNANENPIKSSLVLSANPPKENSATPVKVQEVTLSQLKADETGTAKVKVEAGTTEVRLLITNMDQLTQSKTTIALEGQGFTLGLSSNSIQEWMNQATSKGLQNTEVAIHFNEVTVDQTEELLKKAEALNGATLQAASKLVNFELQLIGENKEKIEVSQFNTPLDLKLKLSGVSDRKLLGLYYVSDEGKLEYRGGKLVGEEIQGSVNHFSKYVLLEYRKVFTDVPIHYWAEDVITEMASKHIVTGVSPTEFAPQENVTRAEFAALLVRALELKAKGKAAFTDVTDEKWYADEVAAAYEAGIVTGRSAQRFAPDEWISREEMSVMIVKAWELKSGKKAGKTDPINEKKNSFKDNEAISEWARAYVDQAYTAGLVQGRSSSQFAPKGIMTRAEAAQVISKL